MKNYFLTIAILSSTFVYGASRPAGLEKAEAAFLAGDAPAMLAETRHALEASKNHPLVAGYAASLIKAASAQGLMAEGSVVMELPTEVTYLGLEVNRRYKVEPGRVTFALTAAVGVSKPHQIEQLQVIRYPDQVMIDYQAGIGESDVESSDTENELWIGGLQTARPVEDGLYLINLKVAGKPIIQGYAILTGKNSSASPVIISPAFGARMNESQPTITWKKFQSPEYVPTERMIMNVTITDSVTDQDIMVARLKDPTATSFKVGDVASARFYQGVKELVPGAYRLRVSFRELEDAGRAYVRRTSTTVMPFVIK